MSKSLGNGIDPLEIIDQYGADALRLTVVTGKRAWKRYAFLQGESGSQPELCQQSMECVPLYPYEHGG